MPSGKLTTTERREAFRKRNERILRSLRRNGHTLKGWHHLGRTQPCEICAQNELLGFVPLDHVYQTESSTGGVDGKGGELHPPAHDDCHCTIILSEAELFDLVESGKYAPWIGTES